MNPLAQMSTLRNSYCVMRHGQSEANCAGIIASHPDHAVTGYGLSATGRTQVEDAVRASTVLSAETVILTSDFLRARETAGIVSQMLGCERTPVTDQRLRERYFGELDLGGDEHYASVWVADRQDPANTARGVESPESVMVRVTDLVVELERTTRNQRYLLVSHGDPLQILQTAFHRRPASAHRELPSLETAEIRLLELPPG